MTSILSKISILLALPFLLSCEKNLVTPSDENLAQALTEEARTASCNTYAYYHKMDGDVTLGKAWGKLVLVGFAEGMTLETRKEFLQQFHRVDSVHGETYLDSGVLTLVQLKANSTCFEAEKLMKELQKLPQVLFANPTFLQRGQEPGTEAWLGVTNEFLVSTEGSGTLQDLEALVQQTKTKIVFSLSDEIHLLSADKNATGHVLELVSFFNRQPTVTMAEPNLIFQFSPSGAASATSLEGQAKTSKETFIR